MNALDKFGEIIAQDLRDSALNTYLDIKSGWLKSEEAKSLHESLSSFTVEQKEVINNLLTKCIDSGIHNFLIALEEKREAISINIDQDNVQDLSDGLQGEPFGSTGWFEKYSQHKEKGI